MSAAPEIFEFSPRYAADFERLNREWLERYFRVEDIDARVLADPQGKIISAGGRILFARLDDRVVGTVALKHQGGGTYELTKMAVTSGYQGRGIGGELLRAAIGCYRTLGGKRLYLESHDSLGTALHMYENAGFVHEPPPEPSPYSRANVYMVYRPTGK